MKKVISTLLVSAMTLMFAAGCAADTKTPETPAGTPVETGVETPVAAGDAVKVTSMLENRTLSADEQASLEKVVKFMRMVDDTVQVALFEMKEIPGGFNMELVLKNNYSETTTVKQGTIIEITTQNEEVVEVPLPKDIEIEANAGVLFDTDVKTEFIKARADIYFIEFQAEEKAQ